MRRKLAFPILLALMTCILGGCGQSKTVTNDVLNDKEMKEKVAEEDKAIDEEEGSM